MRLMAASPMGVNRVSGDFADLLQGVFAAPYAKPRAGFIEAT
jgi:hypothetical protein